MLTDPEGFSLYTYAAVQLWCEAVASAGATILRVVAATLKSAGLWPIVLRDIGFTAKGDPTGVSYVWYVLHDGGFRPMRGSGRSMDSHCPARVVGRKKIQSKFKSSGRGVSSSQSFIYGLSRSTVLASLSEFLMMLSTLFLNTNS